MRPVRQALFGLLLVAVALGVLLLGLLTALGDSAVAASRQESDCIPPAGWQLSPPLTASDSLPELAARYGITVEQIQRANCLPPDASSFTGQRLYLPPQGDEESAP